MVRQPFLVLADCFTKAYFSDLSFLQQWKVQWKVQVKKQEFHSLLVLGGVLTGGTRVLAEDFHCKSLPGALFISFLVDKWCICLNTTLNSWWKIGLDISLSYTSVYTAVQQAIVSIYIQYVLVCVSHCDYTPSAESLPYSPYSVFFSMLFHKNNKWNWTDLLIVGANR